MKYRIISEAGEAFEMTEDPRVIKSQLSSSKGVLANIVTNESASILVRYNDLNLWNSDYIRETQAAATASADAAVLAQKKSAALAKLTPEEKQILGLG